MANLFPFPYADSTKTANGITYTVNSDESVTITGTATDASQFYVVEASDPIELDPGSYTLKGTGNSTIQIALVSVYTPGGSITYIPAGEDDAEFTLTETKEFHAQIGVPSGTTADLTVTPSLVKTGDLVTIDTENAKQIRKSMDVRIQVTPAQGDPIVITNENLISCVVSLRSDLSILEPTLPESEINIEAYMDEDISDILASIPDETPVTYQAGYPGDMSPVRHFYLAEQITWADNVMSIHAVDAVHKLEKEIAAPLKSETTRDILEMPRYFLQVCGIDYIDEWQIPVQAGDVFKPVIIKPGNTMRDLIAYYNIQFNVSDSDGWYDTSTGRIQLDIPCQFIYVDAGIPHLRYYRESETPWDIYESDCGDVQRFTDRAVAQLNYEYEDVPEVDESNDKNVVKAGTGTVIKYTGSTLSFEKMTSDYVIGLYLGESADNDIAQKLLDKYGVVYGLYNTFFVVPPRRDGNYYFDTYDASISYKDNEDNYLQIGQKLAYGEIEQSEFEAYPQKTLNSERGFSQFVPWSNSPNGWRYTTGSETITTMTGVWSVLHRAGIIDFETQNLDVDIYGFCYVANKRSEIARNRNLTGLTVDITNEIPISGTMRADAWHTDSSTGTVESVTVGLFPQVGYTQRLYRSNITGQFIWKGDPRMQPRDVVTFHRLDGTTEEITLENITITHEKGGTSAEITYRKGIC